MRLGVWEVFSHEKEGAGDPREGEELLLLPLGEVGEEKRSVCFLDDTEKRVEPVGERDP